MRSGCGRPVGRSLRHGLSGKWRSRDGALLLPTFVQRAAGDAWDVFCAVKSYNLVHSDVLAEPRRVERSRGRPSRTFLEPPHVHAEVRSAPARWQSRPSRRIRESAASMGLVDPCTGVTSHLLFPTVLPTEKRTAFEGVSSCLISPSPTATYVPNTTWLLRSRRRGRAITRTSTDDVATSLRIFSVFTLPSPCISDLQCPGTMPGHGPTSGHRMSKVRHRWRETRESESE